MERKKITPAEKTINKFDSAKSSNEAEALAKINKFDSAKSSNEAEALAKIKKTVFKFLDPKKYEIFVFGSRASGGAKKYSDYDIGVIGKKPVPSLNKILIEENLEESDLPYKVDIVDFTKISKEFKKIAMSNIKIL